MTVQVLGTGPTGNYLLSHWLAQFSLVVIGRKRSCDVETAAVKRAVRTWRPGKGVWKGSAGWILRRVAGWLEEAKDGTESVSSRYR